MLVHGNQHYLESKPKIKNLYWMEDGKTFCNIFVTDVHKENIPCFSFNKSKEKTLDWFSCFMYVFVSFTSFWVKSILKKRFDYLLKLISKRTTSKTRFFVLARPSYSILKKSAQCLFCGIKTYKNKFLNVSACQWYQIINALNKIWFSHSGWPFHGTAHFNL